MARLGQETQQIVFGTFEELLTCDFGAPLHCLALCGELHPLEVQFLEHLKIGGGISGGISGGSS